jgi:TolB-like protein
MNGQSTSFANNHQRRIGPPLSTAWSHDEVREELKQILSSRFFNKSARLSCFLSTAIDYLLAGKSSAFKEYTVGTEVYQRPTEYDPTQDTIVRTEARRLRSRLKEYYSSCSNLNRVRITLTTGSYVPVIETRCGTRGYRSPETATATLSDEASSIAVVAFASGGIDPSLQHHASDLEEELTHALAQRPNVRVFRQTVQGPSTPSESPLRWCHNGVQFSLRAYVHQAVDGLATQIQLTTADGMILLSARFDGHAMRPSASKIAAAVCRTLFGASEEDQTLETSSPSMKFTRTHRRKVRVPTRERSQPQPPNPLLHRCNGCVQETACKRSPLANVSHSSDSSRVVQREEGCDRCRLQGTARALARCWRSCTSWPHAM